MRSDTKMFVPMKERELSIQKVVIIKHVALAMANKKVIQV